ncbi:MAG: N-acetyltransferase [Gemmatimonadetes bacterium]|nr:N-acetyltransferase [Gemmatimonadota bacterium]
MGENTLVAEGVIIGHPAKDSMLEARDFTSSRGAQVGRGCILRAGTIIYEDAVLGDDVQTAHHVVVREGARVGDGCVLGNNTVVREGAELGRNVRVMESVVISEGALLENDIFIGPGVQFTAGRFMTGAMQAAGKMSAEEASSEEGRYWNGASVTVEEGARIGANAVILAGVRLGRGCIVAAGSVVSNDVPAGGVVMGNPGRLMKRGTP